MKILITAGPMRSYIDPVRFVQNSSSGQMGFEIAKELSALDSNIKFNFLLGPIDSLLHLQFSEMGNVYNYANASEYREALLRLFPESDLFISAAAVLDYEVESSLQKASRAELAQSSTITLKIKPVEDFAALVGSIKKPQQKIFTFSLDTRDSISAIPRAIEKMHAKNADWILLNYANKDSGPEKRTNSGMLISKNEDILLRFTKENKAELAKKIAPLLLSFSTEEKVHEQNI